MRENHDRKKMVKDYMCKSVLQCHVSKIVQLTKKTEEQSWTNTPSILVAAEPDRNIVGTGNRMYFQ